MTLTDRSMGWLNQNRRRAYPMARDGWREVASPQSGLDCVLLDILLFDAGASGGEELVMESVLVAESGTVVGMRYADTAFRLQPDTGGVDGEESFSARVLTLDVDGREVSVSAVMSSHAYIRDVVAPGFADTVVDVGRPVLASRVIRLSHGTGVDGIATNGSSGIADAATAEGELVLEDGYRTSPVILNGRVYVRVGRRYGLDPCNYDFGASGSRDCLSPLFFFCGQNAINGGNVILSGGKGVSVRQGRSYDVRSGLYGKRVLPYAGRTIPCVEVVAGPELRALYGSAS